MTIPWFEPSPGQRDATVQQITVTSAAPAQANWVAARSRGGSDLFGDLAAMDFTAEGAIIDSSRYFSVPPPMPPIAGLVALVAGGQIAPQSMGLPIGAYAISIYLVAGIPNPGTLAGMYSVGFTGLEAAAAAGSTIYLPAGVTEVTLQCGLTTNIVESAPGADDARFNVQCSALAGDGSGALAPMPYQSFSFTMSIEQVRTWTPVYP